MKTSALFFSVFCSFCVSVNGLAQTESKPVLPVGPLIANRLPEAARWNIKTSYVPPAGGLTPQGKNPENVLNSTTTYTKKGAIQREETILSGGEKVEIWRIDAFVVADTGSKDPGVSFVPGRKEAAVFPGFEWISAANFSGIEKSEDGRECLVFRGPASILSKAEWKDVAYSGTAPTENAEAFVDAKTRLPVFLKIGGETRVYSFQQAPTDGVVIPPRIRAAVVEKQKEIQKAQIRPPAP